MPIVQFITNVEINDVRSFVKKLSQITDEITGKPERYITVHVQYDPNLTFGRTFDPAFQMTLISLGNINPESNVRYSKGFFSFFREELGIPDDRGYIYFVDPARANLGSNSTTEQALLEKA